MLHVQGKAEGCNKSLACNKITGHVAQKQMQLAPASRHAPPHAGCIGVVYALCTSATPDNCVSPQPCSDQAVMALPSRAGTHGTQAGLPSMCLSTPHPSPQTKYSGSWSRPDKLLPPGGEGATVREVLRHNSVEKVIMVDIDQVCPSCRASCHGPRVLTAKLSSSERHDCDGSQRPGQHWDQADDRLLPQSAPIQACDCHSGPLKYLSAFGSMFVLHLCMRQPGACSNIPVLAPWGEDDIMHILLHLLSC